MPHYLSVPKPKSFFSQQVHFTVHRFMAIIFALLLGGERKWQTFMRYSSHKKRWELPPITGRATSASGCVHCFWQTRILWKSRGLILYALYGRNITALCHVWYIDRCVSIFDIICWQTIRSFAALCIEVGDGISLLQDLAYTALSSNGIFLKTATF